MDKNKNKFLIFAGAAFEVREGEAGAEASIANPGQGRIYPQTKLVGEENTDLTASHLQDSIVKRYASKYIQLFVVFDVFHNHFW